MKKILSLTLASAMVMSMTAGAFAAPADLPVGGIDSNGFAYDTDLAAVDLTVANPDFSYGDTIFYPILNNVTTAGDAAIATARAELATAVGEKEAADADLLAKKGVASTKSGELDAALEHQTTMNLVLAAATAWATAVDAPSEQGVIDAAKEEYIRLAGLHLDNTVSDSAANAVIDVQDNHVDPADTAVGVKTGEKSTADGNVTTAEGVVTTKEGTVTAKQTALNTLLATATPFVHESDAVDNIKVRDTWEMNGKLVEDVSIVKKKIHAGNYVPAEKYVYFVAVDLEESTETDEEDIHGLIQLRKSGDDSFEYEDMQLDVNIEIGFPEATDNTITKDIQIFSNGNGFNDDSEDELNFASDEDSYFTVNTMGQGELLLSMTSRFNKTVADRFPSANLDFLTGNGESFNKIGVLSISAPEDVFMYKLSENGTLTLIETEYDEYDEVHNFKTRSLDSYVISDVELEGTEAPDVDSDEDNDGTITPDDSTDGNVNPNTGAIA